MKIITCVKGMSGKSGKAKKKNNRKKNKKKLTRVYSVGGKNEYGTMSGRESPVAGVSDDGWWDVEPTGVVLSNDELNDLNEMTIEHALWAYIETLSLQGSQANQAPTANTIASEATYSAHASAGWL